MSSDEPDQGAIVSAEYIVSGAIIDNAVRAAKKASGLYDASAPQRLEGKLDWQPHFQKCKTCRAEYIGGLLTICPKCSEEHDRRRVREGIVRQTQASIPLAYSALRLESDELARRVKNGRAIELAQRVASLKHVCARALFVGPSGAGKSSLAAATIVAWAAANNASATWCAAWQLAGARAQHALGDGEPRIVEEAIAAPLLLLDDIGTERHTPQSAVSDVILARYDTRRPTWATTWMTSEELAARYGDGVARRLRERAIIIDCTKPPEKKTPAEGQARRAPAPPQGGPVGP